MPERPWWKRKWGIAGIVVAVLLVLGGLGNAINPPSPVSTTSQSPSPSVAVATESDTPTLSPVTDSPSPSVLEEPTDGPTTEPIPDPTTAAAQAILKKTAGRGDKIVRFTAQDTPGVARITSKGAGNFAVISYLGSEYGDLLVNQIGSYSGWVYVAPGIDRLRITASGSWTVEVQPVDTARAWDGSDTLTGKGDAVVVLSGGASGITTIKNRSQSNFAVTAYGLNGEYLDLIVNEIGSYSGEVLLPEADPMVVVINAVGGTWSMSAIAQ